MGTWSTMHTCRLPWKPRKMNLANFSPSSRTLANPLPPAPGPVSSLAPALYSSCENTALGVRLQSIQDCRRPLNTHPARDWALPCVQWTPGLESNWLERTASQRSLGFASSELLPDPVVSFRWTSWWPAGGYYWFPSWQKNRLCVHWGRERGGGEGVGHMVRLKTEWMIRVLFNHRSFLFHCSWLFLKILWFLLIYQVSVRKPFSHVCMCVYTHHFMSAWVGSILSEMHLKLIHFLSILMAIH